MVLQNENYVMTKLVRTFALALLSTAMACGTAHASFFQGSINARFENPVLQGSIYSPGGAVTQSFDNTSSARYTIYSSATSATVNWGTNAGGPGSSTLNFFGNQDVTANGNEEFQFGTVTYYNGTSTLESLIFGIDLVLDFIPTGSTLSVETLRLHVGIGTTENTGDANANADYISIPGIDRAFFTFEGLGATAYVNGTIVEPSVTVSSFSPSIQGAGDPYLNPQSFTVLDQFTLYTGPATYEPYNPDDYTTFNSPGFAGGFTGPIPSATPEPGSLALLLTGVCAVIGARSFRRSKKQA